MEVDGEDGLHAVVGEPLAELVADDEEHALRVAQRLQNITEKMYSKYIS